MPYSITTLRRHCQDPSELDLYGVTTRLRTSCDSNRKKEGPRELRNCCTLLDCNRHVDVTNRAGSSFGKCCSIHHPRLDTFVGPSVLDLAQVCTCWRRARDFSAEMPKLNNAVLGLNRHTNQRLPLRMSSRYISGTQATGPPP